jgi:hypothetical protein
VKANLHRERRLRCVVRSAFKIQILEKMWPQIGQEFVTKSEAQIVAKVGQIVAKVGQKEIRH